MTIDSQTVHSGSHSLLLQSDDFARCSVGPQGLFLVTPGERYRIGVWVKPGADFQIQPGSPGVVIRVGLSSGAPPRPTPTLLFIYADHTFSPGQTALNSPLPVKASLSIGWTHLEGVLDVPTNVDAFSPVLFFWKAKGSLSVDDFSFEKVDDSVPASALAPGAPPPEATTGPSQPEVTLPIPSAAEINEVAAMLPPEPQGVGRPITDRQAWAIAAQQPAFQKQLKDAEKYATEPIPVMNDTIYRQVIMTGHFDLFNWNFRKRSMRLNAFVVSECIQNQGQYLPLIEKELDAILSEETWVDPLHALLGSLPDGKNGIDLGVAARAWTVATADYWLGDKLKPETRQRIRTELNKRVFQKYEEAARTGKARWWWMDAGNNWNAVCNASVVGTALTILPSPQERALIICSARNDMSYYEQSFTDDGYCREGMAYWNYGFGNYLCLAETVYEATQGKINLFAGEKIRKMALFPKHFEIMDGIYPAFGDAPLILHKPKSAEPGTALLTMINQRWGMNWTDLDPADSDMFAMHPIADRLNGFGLFGFPLPAYGGSLVAGSPPPPEESTVSNLRFFFKDASVLITRSERPGAARLGLAIKGGDNGAPHAHNDNGSYVVVCNGETLLVDPGSEGYTADTFSSRRFQSMMLNSYGHDVPYVGKTLQKSGAESQGKIVSTKFTDDKDTLVMDLSQAYAVPGLKKLQRIYVLDRTQPSIEITDEADFDQPTDFGSALITVSNWQKQGPGTFLITGQNAAVKATVTVDNGLAIADREEPITEHSPVKNNKRTRIGINLTGPTSHVVMHTLIVPAELPATSGSVSPAPSL